MKIKLFSNFLIHIIQLKFMHFDELLKRKDVPLDVKEALKSCSSEIEDLKAKLKTLKVQYQLIIDSLTDAVHIVNEKLEFLYVNKKFRNWIKKLGFDSFILNQSLIESFPFLSDSVKDEYNQVFTTGKSLSTEEVHTVSGEEIFTEVQKIPVFQDDRVCKVITVVKNISDRKYREKELQSQTSVLKSQSETFLDGILIVDNENNSIVTNTRFEEMWQIPKEKIKEVRNNLTHNIILNQLKTPNQYLKKVNFLTTHQNEKSRDLIELKDGRTFDIYSSPLEGPYGNYYGRIWYFRDISEFKKAEEDVRETQQQLQNMFDNTPAAVYAKDLEGRYILVNRQWCERTGVLEHDAIGKTSQELFPNLDSELWLSHEKQVLESGKSLQIEEVGQTTGRIYLATKFVLRDIDSKIYAFCNSSIDITERKRAEEALRESEEKYRMLVEQLEEGVLLERLDGTISFINPKMASILGYTPNEILNNHWSKFVPKEEHMKVISEREKRLEGKSSEYETILQAKNGSHIPVDLSAAPVYSSEEEMTGILCVFNDITQRKEAEKLLQESEEKYRYLVERANDGILIIQNGLLTYANERLIRMADMTIEEVINTPFLNYIHPDQVSKVLDRYRSRMAGEKVPSLYETVLIKKDGSPVNVEINADLITYQGEPADLVFVRDVSDRKKAEEQLQILDKAIESSINGIVITDRKLNLTFVNSAFLRMWRYTSKEEVQKLQIFAFWDDPIETQTTLDELRKNKKWIGERTAKRSDGSLFDVQISANIVEDAKGTPLCMMASFLDITERKQAEKSLLESRKLLRQVIDLVPQQIFAKDALGRFIFANQAVAAAYGTTVDNLVNKYQSNVHLSKEELEAYLESDLEVINGGRPVFIPEETFTDSNGVIHSIQTLKIPFKMPELKELAILGVSTDITDLKEAEKSLKLIKAEEERYHAMLSHFTRNELQKIVNNVDILRFEYKSDDRLNEDVLNEIVSVANRSSKTIDNVTKIFEVLQIPFFRPRDGINISRIINELTTEVIPLIQNVEVDHPSIEIELFVDDYIREALKEILLFIVSEIKDHEAPQTAVYIRGSLFSSYYCLSICENNTPPIPMEVSFRLSGKITDEWEYQGHYIGISLVSVIMQHYNGRLVIYSSKECGNEFQLHFPIDLIDNFRKGL
jgi:PAS domain S-box-containing protein